MCGVVWEDVKWGEFVPLSLWIGSCAPSYTNTQLTLHDSKYSSILSIINNDIDLVHIKCIVTITYITLRELKKVI